MSDIENKPKGMSTPKKAAIGVGLAGAIAAGGFTMTNNISTNTADTNTTSEANTSTKSTGGDDNSKTVGDIKTKGAVSF